MISVYRKLQQLILVTLNGFKCIEQKRSNLFHSCIENIEKIFNAYKICLRYFAKSSYK